MQIPEVYKSQYIDRQFERAELFEQVQKQYTIQSALYPGCYVHITPSFFIQLVIYVDSDRKAKTFFSDLEDVRKFIDARKIYSAACEIRFFPQDYRLPIEITDNSIDLLISHWAGPVSQTGKRYLKKGGILLANNSHADAGIAFLDPDYKLIGVVQPRQGGVSITEEGLADYFIPKKDRTVTLDDLAASGKGIAYRKTASSYIFKKTH